MVLLVPETLPLCTEATDASEEEKQTMTTTYSYDPPPTHTHPAPPSSLP